MVIDRRLVDRLNSTVRKIGDENVSVLDNVREFRKRINFLEWKHKCVWDGGGGAEACAPCACDT